MKRERERDIRRRTTPTLSLTESLLFSHQLAKQKGEREKSKQDDENTLERSCSLLLLFICEDLRQFC